MQNKNIKYTVCFKGWIRSFSDQVMCGNIPFCYYKGSTCLNLRK